jgi:hypothetical protein
MRLAWPVFAAAAGAALSAPGAAAQDRIEPDVPHVAIARQAERGRAPLWRLPLGPVKVDEMRPVPGGRLLVGLRRDETRLRNLEHVLVRMDDGTVLWRVKRDPDGTSGTLVVLDDEVVFYHTENDRYTVNAVALETGAERWKRSYKGDTVTARPAPTEDRVLLERRRKDRVDLLALGLSDGREVWSLRYKIEKGRPSHPPIVWPEGALVFSDDVARVALSDGAVVWERPDLVPDSGDAPPQMYGETLFVTAGHTVTAVALADGATRWTAPLAGCVAITNVFPDSAAVYVRGIADAEGRQRLPGDGIFVLTALRPEDGAVRWQRRTARPTLSNLVQVGGRVFAASVDRLFAFDAATGRPLFEVPTGATRLYPVRLRGYPDRVAFIGEHALAAFDTATGARRTWVGMTPLSQATTLAGLDAAIPRLKADIAALSTGVSPQGPGMASWATGEMNRYQNLANQYRSQAWSQASRGDYMGAELSSMQSRMNSGWSKSMANLAFALSILDLARAIQQSRLKAQIARVEGLLEHQLMLRESILSGNSLAEAGDWVYRPHWQLVDGSGFASMVVVHLPTGRRRTTIVSANYQSHGMWNLLDPERGVLYHEGIGLDTAAWTWSPRHDVWPQKNMRTIETFLLATPVEVP